MRVLRTREDRPPTRPPLVAAIGLVLALMALAGMVFAAPAAAAPGGAPPAVGDDVAVQYAKYRLVSSGTGLCLDSNSAGNVYGHACNSGANQLWEYNWATGTLRNFATGRCLDGNHAGAVYTLGCNGGMYQVWVEDTEYDNPRPFIHGTHRCLDGWHDGRIYTEPCNGGSYQRWWIQLF